MEADDPEPAAPSRGEQIVVAVALGIMVAVTVLLILFLRTGT